MCGFHMRHFLVLGCTVLLAAGFGDSTARYDKAQHTEPAEVVARIRPAETVLSGTHAPTRDPANTFVSTV